MARLWLVLGVLCAAPSFAAYWLSPSAKTAAWHWSWGTVGTFLLGAVCFRLMDWAAPQGKWLTACLVAFAALTGGTFLFGSEAVYSMLVPVRWLAPKP